MKPAIRLPVGFYGLAPRVRAVTRFSGLTILVLCIACTHRSRTPSAGGTSADVTRPIATQPIPCGRNGWDQTQFEIACEIPGFAGVGRDRDGTPRLLLTHRGSEQAARARAAVLFASPGGDPDVDLDEDLAREVAAAFRVSIVKYDYLQLDTWIRQFGPVGAMPGIQVFGIDVRCNRIYLGLRTGTDTAPIADAVSRLPIPPDAVSFSPHCDATW